MRTAMRPRYYCDHCNKGNGSPSAMKRHESGCTLNPARVCRMCALFADQGGEPAPPLAELLRILDTEGFSAMRETASDCPACTLAVIRARSTFDPETGPHIIGPEDGRESWSYAHDKTHWWAAYNDKGE